MMTPPQSIRQEQYEVWVQKSEKKWEMLYSFKDLSVAFAIAKNRPSRTRLICITYEYGKMISQDLIEELGIKPGQCLRVGPLCPQRREFCSR